MNILVIAPHPDDEVIGCGGSLCLHAEQGDRVAVTFLTSGELGLKKLRREQAWAIREAEARKAAKILGIKSLNFLRLPDWCIGDDIPAAAKALATVLRAEQPDLIYLPHPADGHPDHQASLTILRVALKSSRLGLPALRAYEVWTPLATFDQVQDITPVMPRKLRALRAHRSQLGEFDYVRAMRSLNQYRGALAAKSRYAEVFQSIALGRSR
jgi:LmbE family N-acetylglucosaminyl deacetylase